MATREELNAALDSLVGDVATVFQEMNEGFARLQAKIDAGSSAADLSAELAKVADVRIKLAEAIADAESETPEEVA